MLFKQLLCKLVESGKYAEIFITNQVLEEIEFDDLFVIIYLMTVNRCPVKFRELSIYRIEIIGHLPEDVELSNHDLCNYEISMEVNKQTEKIDIIAILCRLYCYGAIELVYMGDRYKCSCPDKILEGLMLYDLMNTRVGNNLLGYIQHKHDRTNATRMVRQYLGIDRSDTKSARKI